MRTSGAAAALATAGIVVAVDQATKQWAISRIERGDEEEGLGRVIGSAVDAVVEGTGR